MPQPVACDLLLVDLQARGETFASFSPASLISQSLCHRAFGYQLLVVFPAAWCHLAVLTTAQTVLSSGFLFKSDSWLLGERGGVAEGEGLLIASLSAMLALSSFDVTDSWSLSSQSKGELLQL